MKRLLTNLMELSPSWEVAICAATQELPSILWNPKVHYMLTRAHHFPIPSQIDHSLGRLSKESVQVRDPLWHFVTSLFFYGEELLDPRPTPKLEDHLLLAFRGCLYSIFAAVLHISRPFPPSATWRRTMPWWQGTHLTWDEEATVKINLK
jgi:hypothetical protein